MRNTFQVIGFAGAFTTLIIGMHQSIYHGLANSYFYFAFSIGFLLLLSYARKQMPEKEDTGKGEKDSKTNSEKGYKNKNQPLEPRRLRRRNKRRKQ